MAEQLSPFNLLHGCSPPAFGDDIEEPGRLLARVSMKSIRRSPAELDASAKGFKTGFLHLSPELRNQIYEYVAHATSLVPRYARPQSTTSPALLSVARQIKKEYKPILLSLATITFPVWYFDFGRPVTYIESRYIGPDRRFLSFNERLTAEFIMDQLNDHEQEAHWQSMQRILNSGIMHKHGLTWQMRISWTKYEYFSVQKKREILLHFLEKLSRWLNSDRLDGHIRQRGHDIVKLFAREEAALDSTYIPSWRKHCSH